MESRTYEGRDLKLHAFVREGRDPAVVLLHGAGANGLAWLPLLPAFGDRKVIAPDLPGHGSSPPVADWSLEPLVRRIADLVGRAHPGPLLWGGHSWGGKMAAILAGVRPDAIAALVLVDPSPASPVPVQAETFVEEAFSRELGPWDSVDEAVASVRDLPQYARWDEDVERSFRHGLVQTPEGRVEARVKRQWLVEISAAALLHDDSEAISRIDCPALLVIADRSLYWQEPTNLRVLPRVERVVLPGHHWIHRDNPAALVEAVAPWVRRLDPDTGRPR